MLVLFQHLSNTVECTVGINNIISPSCPNVACTIPLVLVMMQEQTKKIAYQGADMPGMVVKLYKTQQKLIKCRNTMSVDLLCPCVLTVPYRLIRLCPPPPPRKTKG